MVPNFTQLNFCKYSR